jgi:hypothetical protein
VNGIFARVQLAWRRRVYRKRATLLRFMAPDVCREVAVVHDSELADGIATARIRTWNVLFAVKGLSARPELGPANAVALLPREAPGRRALQPPATRRDR